MNIPAAKILEQTSHIVPGKLRITEHFFQVPRDYSSPNSGSLRLFARSAQKHEVPIVPEDAVESKPADKKDQLPWLVYLQGGPGFPCRPPQDNPMTRSFLEKGYQMLWLDQRGTGLSSPISVSTLAKQGDSAAQAKYLKSFRADSIVRDCEAIRKVLTAEYPEQNKQWSVIGQSFGGFCIVTYLSLFPQSLREAFICGGLAPLVDSPDEVYSRLFKKVISRNDAYYDKYPEDLHRVKRILGFLGRSSVMPSGGLLTPRRFLQLGLDFGFHGGIDGVHQTVLRVANELDTMGHMTRQTLDEVERLMPFDNNLIYAILHEPLYCQGNAPKWSAQRVMDTFPSFQIDKSSSRPLFTGEMIFPFMFECYPELQKLKDVAEILANDADWPALYDKAQLAQNEVPVYAAVYVDDLYVDFGFSMETAAAIKGCKTYITNVMYHDAVRSKMEEVVEALWKLRCDTID